MAARGIVGAGRSPGGDRFASFAGGGQEKQGRPQAARRARSGPRAGSAGAVQSV